jgi:hypothetical protein
MTNHWSGVTIDCIDPIRMSIFWGLLLGIEPSNEHGDDPGWATVGSRSGTTPRLTFQRVPESKSTKVRIHLGGRWSGTRHDYDEGVVLVPPQLKPGSRLISQATASAPA